jgi:hypothetical protein
VRWTTTSEWRQTFARNLQDAPTLQARCTEIIEDVVHFAVGVSLMLPSPRRMKVAIIEGAKSKAASLKPHSHQNLTKWRRIYIVNSQTDARAQEHKWRGRA